jgi:hypothetical protein
MHTHSKHNCISSKDGVNDPGLSFAGKVGLGPFWTLGPGLELPPCIVALRRHLRRLLLARAYVYRQKDLHKDANAKFTRRFLLQSITNHK